MGYVVTMNRCAPNLGRHTTLCVVLFLFLLLPQPVAADASLLLFADHLTLSGEESVSVTFARPGHYTLHDLAARAAVGSADFQPDDAPPLVQRERAEDPAARSALLPLDVTPSVSETLSDAGYPPARMLVGQTIAPWSPPPRLLLL
jgi:hypothetical protein